MDRFNSMRHGPKLSPGEERKPLEESGLTREQQEQWQEAVERLGIQDDPEVQYETLPLIQKLAREVYDQLPQRAVVVFASTEYPRAKITADFLATELLKIAMESNDKEISIAYMWEPIEEATKEDSVSQITDVRAGYTGVWHLMRAIADRDSLREKVPELAEYLDQNDGNKSHPYEDELTLKAMNEDLASPSSIFRSHIPHLRERLRKAVAAFEHDRPIYFFGVGHHSNLVALDVALKKRARYASVDEMPPPLAIWSADRSEIDAFLNEHEA